MSPQITSRGRGAGADCRTPVGASPSFAHAIAVATSSVSAGATSKLSGIGHARLPNIATAPIMLMRTSARPPRTGSCLKYWSNLNDHVRPMRAPIDSRKSDVPSPSRS